MAGISPFTTFTHLPPVSHEKYKRWYRVIFAIHAAIREKYWALGQYLWPKTANIWSQGKVSSVTDNADGTFTFTDASTPPADATTVFHPPIVGLPRPPAYDIIFSHNDLDPSMQVRAPLESFTEVETDPETGEITVPHTFTVRDYSDYVTAGCISGINPPGTGKWYLIGRDKPWWGDRDPGKMRSIDWPNDFEFTYGATKECINPDDDTVFKDRVILKEKWAWAKNIVGKDLLLYDTATPPKLHRVVITEARTATALDTSNADDAGKRMVVFANTSWQPKDDGAYTVVKTGGIAFPGRTDHPFMARPKAWYTGVMEEYFIHVPDDAITTMSVIAVDQVDAPDGSDVGSCPITGTPEAQKDVFYKDAWTSPENVCGIPDASLSPFIYKCLGMLLAEIENLAQFFVPPFTYPVAGRNIKQTFTFALLMQFINVNAGTATVIDKVGTDGDYTANVGADLAGKRVFFTVLEPVKKRNLAGMNKLTDSAIVGGDGIIILGGSGALYNEADELADPNHPSNVGSPVFWTSGWPRRRPRMVRWKDDAYGLLPDVDPLTELTIFPLPDQGSLDASYPTTGSQGVGRWSKRLKSTNEMQFDDHGYVFDGPALQNDKYYRWMGDDWTYPTASRRIGSDGAQDERFVQRMDEKVHSPALMKLLLADVAGTITSHTANSFTDAAQNWFRGWWEGGEARVQEFNPTSKGNTFLEDTSLAPDSKNAWFRPERFDGFSFPYEGFVLELEHTVDTVTTTYKVVPTTVDPDVVRVEWADFGVDLTEGTLVGRIREPNSILNRFGNRKVKITRADKTTFEMKCWVNDNNTAFFTDAEMAEKIPEGFQDGWTYEFQIDYPGPVLKREDDAFVYPTGVDTRGGELFQKDSAFNAPDWVKDFGFPCKFDYQSMSVLESLVLSLNAMHVIAYDGSWYHGPDYDGSGDLLADEIRNNWSFWDGVEYQARDGECGLSGAVYSNYGYAGDGTALYQTTLRLGSFSTSIVDANPKNENVITAKTGSSPGDLGFSISGIWNGPSAVGAQLKGTIPATYVTGRNGIKVKIFNYAVPPVLGATPGSTNNVTFNAEGNAVLNDQWKLQETTLTKNVAFDGFHDPEDGRFISERIGNIETGTVPLTVKNEITGEISVVQQPPLPPIPTPECEVDTGLGDVQGRGFRVIDQGAHVDWNDYFTFKAPAMSSAQNDFMVVEG
jgi:hypothetical protein